MDEIRIRVTPPMTRAAAPTVVDPMQMLGHGERRKRRTPEFWNEVAQHEFADWLGGVIADDGRTKNELVGKMGISIQYLNRLLCGRLNLTVASINKHAVFFGYRLKITFEKIDATTTAGTTAVTASAAKNAKP